MATPPTLTDPTETEAPRAQKCVHVIFNPTSGTGDPERRKESISQALARHDYTCQFIATSLKEDAQALAKKAIKEGAGLLAVSGGDGTVMEAMAALVGTGVPIAVLPAGTGNLLSVNLGIPMTVPEAVDVALGGKVYELDLARTQDDRYFAIMGGIGLDAQVIADTGRQAKRRLGVLAYFVAALKNLPRRRAWVEIRLDDRPPIRRRVKTVMVANMGKITGGLEAVPTASPDDGLLDVVVMRTETVGQWLRLLVYALLGRSQDDPSFDVHQAKRISIRVPRPQLVEFDGEDGGEVRELTVEVVPRAVRVLVPHDSPAARDTARDPSLVARERARRQVVMPVVLAVAALGALWVWRRRSQF